MQHSDILVQTRGGGGTKGTFFNHGSFGEIVSLENLFAAWSEFRLGKTGKGDVQAFEFNLEDNLFRLHEELVNRTYRHSEYTPFFVTDPKVRHIHKASVRDRVLHHAIFRVLYPVFDRSFIFDSYSCRVGKGTHRAVARLGSFLAKASSNNGKNVWALKCDVSKFFDSVDQGILLELLSKKVQDEGTLWLIRSILESFHGRKRTGIPLGNVTSQLFANVYLDELDQFAKHELRASCYLRYCDDFIIVHEDKAHLEAVICRLQNFLDQRLRLKLHPKKIVLRKYSQGVDFLGYVVRPHCTVLRTKTKNRMLRNLTDKHALFLDGDVGRYTFSQTVQSYLGAIKHSDGYTITQAINRIIEGG